MLECALSLPLHSLSSSPTPPDILLLTLRSEVMSFKFRNINTVEHFIHPSFKGNVLRVHDVSKTDQDSKI